MNKETIFKPEILAPAGDAERAYIAAESGADAVYFGLERFSARNAAVNIKLSELNNLIRDLHRQNVRSYITLNTILYQSELSKAEEYLQICVESKADGVIIQDLSWLKLISKLKANIELHASTQMNIHSNMDIQTAADLGFHRIVLPRETSEKQLKIWSIKARKLNLETEFFVHGALCMAVSGRCQMSFSQGGRSANRGACAQPCRLAYQLTDKNNNYLDQGALLSAKDQSLINSIPLFSKLRINSLKIEGRMKDAAYVRATTSSFRQAVDFWAKEKDESLFRKFANEEEVKLLQIFNRGGSFTKKSFHLTNALDYVSKDFVGNHGVFLGEIVELNINKGRIVFKKENNLNEDTIKDKRILENTSELKARDKIAIRRKSKQIAVAPIGIINKLKNNISIKGFHPQKMRQMKIGDEVYLLQNYRLEKALEEKGRAKNDLKIQLLISSESLLVQAEAILKDKSIFHEFNYQLNKSKLLQDSLPEKRWTQQLSKTGNTIFDVKDVKYNYQEKKYLPALRISEINHIRRELIEKLNEKIADDIESEQVYHFNHLLKKKNKSPIHINKNKKTKLSKELLSIVNPEALSQIHKLNLIYFDQIEISMLFMTDPATISELFKKSWKINPELLFLIKLPEMMQEKQLDVFYSLQEEYQNNPRFAFSANGLSVLQEELYQGMLKHINEQANIINKESLSLILDYTNCSVTLSPEWNDQSLDSFLSKLSDEVCARIYIPKNYATPEMFLNYCPVGKNVKGCKKCIKNEKAMWSQTYELETLQKPNTKHQLITYPVACVSEIFTNKANNTMWDNLSFYNQSRVSIRQSDFYFA